MAERQGEGMKDSLQYHLVYISKYIFVFMPCGLMDQV